MASTGDMQFLESAAIYLGAAVVAVPLFKRLQLGSVLGYLAAGVLIGPHALELIPEASTALHVAEFGVVLLLFVIGLELKPDRLWRLRMDIFGLGTAQVVVSALVIGFGLWFASSIAWDWRLTTTEAIIAGAGLALSSTAFAVQLLREKGDFATPYGERSFAVLLFQDLAIVPLIALAALLAPAVPGETAEPLWIAIGKPVVAVVLVYVVGKYGMRPLFRELAKAKADEVFTAAALLVVVASALIMDLAGLSMAMGAFVAGLLLAESEFRHQLETDIEPFRGLLMGLFFIAVGMNIDLRLVVQQLGPLIGVVVFLLAAKVAILYALTRVSGSNQSDALRVAATLSQGGDFGFVLFSVGMANGAMGVATGSLLTAAATLSMALTPLLVHFADRSALPATETGEDVPGVESAPNAPIIIAGFGRVGQVIGRILRLRGYDLTLIDASPERIRLARSFDNDVYFGDATRLDVLANAGAAEAQAIFLCIDDRDGTQRAVSKIKQRFPNVKLIVATYDRFTMMQLDEAGVDHIERETFEAAISMTRRGLEMLGDNESVDDLIEEFRRRDRRLLRLQSEYGAHEGLKKMREEFTLERER
ncbi:MAG: monovalent cation:proton antiporter-2 (CPA2) family protein [Pseudomonadota bacterium]